METWSTSVSKKNGSLRPCGNYRRLNTQMIPDRYPIPRIEDFHHILKKKTKIFSKIDLFKAYFQIPISVEAKEKTAIITPFGLYELNVISFGLRNAPSTFQRFINEVFFGLDFVFAYLDDILVASSTEDEHSKRMKVVLLSIRAIWSSYKSWKVGYGSESIRISRTHDYFERIETPS
ncbi:Transposon Ty3-I Gag-Pol polyprotein [Araneus ventricosus]|uniref:Transposon Ty3-I Gag-Pol polyprotein n=1 Tax=Araneus ventricosus TaxID=182803 RepID=A0A4Y2JLV6_ARAVE|nr:Transposon Ty3-I Gag-Pol polyprotein [Araneus ventricosus]